MNTAYTETTLKQMLMDRVIGSTTPSVRENLAKEQDFLIDSHDDIWFMILQLDSGTKYFQALMKLRKSKMATRNITLNDFKHKFTLDKHGAIEWLFMRHIDILDTEYCIEQIDAELMALNEIYELFCREPDLSPAMTLPKRPTRGKRR